jgi:F-type H+-transporting ATPase subunit b
MPRQPKTALGPGLAALALGIGLALGVSPRAAVAADEPAKTHAKAASSGPAHAAGGSPVAAAEHLVESHEAPHEPDILEPQPSLAIWTVVVFLGLLIVLRKFAWKPLLAALHQREEHLEHVLLETERARNESERLLAEHRRRLAAAEEQVRALIEEGRKSAQLAADEIIKRAQSEAESAKLRAERDIAMARDQALSEIWSKTADLAVSVAGKVLDKSLSEDDHRRLVESAIAELPLASAGGHGGRAA